jgi:BTB/POZ domain-containing protein
MEQQQQLRYDNPNCPLVDLVIVVESHTFYCHRVQLWKHSEYFRVIMTAPMKEKRLSQVVIKEVTMEHFRLFLDYVYDRLNWNEYKLSDLLIILIQMGQRFMCQSLIQKCFERTDENTDLTFPLLELLREHKHPKFMSLFMKYCQELKTTDHAKGIFHDASKETLELLCECIFTQIPPSNDNDDNKQAKITIRLINRILNRGEVTILDAIHLLESFPLDHFGSGSKGYALKFDLIALLKRQNERENNNSMNQSFWRRFWPW